MKNEFDRILMDAAVKRLSVKIASIMSEDDDAQDLNVFISAACRVITSLIISKDSDPKIRTERLDTLFHFCRHLIKDNNQDIYIVYEKNRTCIRIKDRKK